MRLARGFRLLLSSSLLLQITGSPGFAQTLESQEPTSEHAQTVLPAVTVHAPRNLGYQAPSATTATRLETPILETPVSIAVVPRAVMDDQQVIELKEALKNVSGV